MKDRVIQDIGAKRQLQDWSTINWRTVKRHVKTLKQRIFRATKNKQWNLVRSLMKLMFRSYSNLLLSVSKVTQKNKGRKTPGVDDQVVLTPKARVKLVKQMSNYQTWKANGKRRPLGILTIKIE